MILSPVKRLLLTIAILISVCSIARDKYATLTNGFAHNDYRHRRPLFDALHHGFSFIEADIYLHKGKLVVSHWPPLISRRKKTLEELYFKPLQDSLQFLQQDGEPINLVIDLKTSGNTVDILFESLKNYTPLLSTLEHGCMIKRKITIILSGKIPTHLTSEQSRYLFLDRHFTDEGHRPAEAAGQYLLSSCKYKNLLTWDGQGSMPENQRQLLVSYVTDAHAAGMKVRLWASPENTGVWKALLECGVDLINTDRIEKLSRFLQKTP